MRLRYNKQGVSVWERKLTIVLGLLAGVTLLLFAVLAVTLFINRAEVDDCLDSGGQYDHEEGRCEPDVDPPNW